MNKDRLWTYIQIFSVIFVVGTMAILVFTLTEPVGGGVRKLVSKPWWLLWVLVIMGIVGFFGVLADVRRRNNGEVNLSVIIQSIFYLGFLLGVLFLFRFLVG